MQLAGAANTLTFRADGSIYADNTDGLGLVAEQVKPKDPSDPFKDEPVNLLLMGTDILAAAEAARAEQKNAKEKIR